MVEMVSGLQVGSWWAFVHMALNSRERQGGGGAPELWACK